MSSLALVLILERVEENATESVDSRFRRLEAIKQRMLAIDASRFVVYNREMSNQDNFELRHFEKEEFNGLGYIDTIKTILELLEGFRFDNIIVYSEASGALGCETLLTDLSTHEVVFQSTIDGKIAAMGLRIQLPSEFWKNIDNENQLVDAVLACKEFGFTYQVIGELLT